MLNDLLRRFRNKGFVGPYYRGLPGKLRFAWEHFVFRTEVVFAATRDTVPTEPASSTAALELHIIQSADELDRYRAALDASYYPGFTDNWARPFTWGEVLILGLDAGRPAGFTWLQRGSSEGFFTYYGLMLEGEARLLRAGVLPEFRGKGIYTELNRLALLHLFTDGVSRVFIDCHLRNVAAFKAHVAAGFRPIGMLRVIPGLGNRPYISWRPYAANDATP